MSVLVVREQVATLIIAAPGGGGGGAVDSVNGETGVVELDHTDVGAAAVSHTHDYADIDGLGNAALHDESDFELAGTSQATVMGHVAQPDPHTQYAMKTVMGAVLNNVVSIASVTPVDLAAPAVTAAIGEMYRLRLFGNLRNNSSATRSFTFTFSFGGMSCTAQVVSIPSSPTNQVMMTIDLWVTIANASNARLYAQSLGSGIISAATSSTIGTNATHNTWNESASDLTGPQTLRIQAHSSSATGQQEFIVNAWELELLRAP